MKPRARRLEHRLRLILVEEVPLDEEPEHGTAEGFGEPRSVVRGPPDEGAIGAEAAVGDDQMQVRIPVGERAVGLQDRDFSLTTLLAKRHEGRHSEIVPNDAYSHDTT
jgi:hypothetical protein